VNVPDLGFIDLEALYGLLKCFMPNRFPTLPNGVAGLFEQVRQPIG
jgi:hypothetical protein